MSRVVNRVVRVHAVRAGRPEAFRWDGRWHRVVEVLDVWVYREPWWQRSIFAGPGAAEAGPGRAPERTYYRVRVGDGGVVELVQRSEDRTWRLYRVFD